MTKPITGTFTFPANEPALQDHFPDSPIIPGTLIIHSFVNEVRSHMPEATLGIRKFRFKSFITPDSYAYRIEPKPFGYACTLFKGTEKAVTGRIVVESNGGSDA
ncbi:hypothetical protein [Halodesulfovibrio sp.]|uniref:hypothetical protein n=1 Tax=Halodesulfovibrio sp. TaxID=1912772 RepID=UPI0025FFD03F|nr:hypothetical protein [Halodesulfovibrio sp.]MCT4534597.1 hypothetical protein [Halodesulfovibrio sp.]